MKASILIIFFLYFPVLAMESNEHSNKGVSLNDYYTAVGLIGTADIDHESIIDQASASLSNFMLSDLQGITQSYLKPDAGCSHWFALSSIEKLTLVAQNNLLTTVDWDVCTCTNLVKLNLARNRISSLPDRLSHLTGLKILNLASNQLHELNVSLCSLSKLEALKLSNNHITVLPDQINRLQKVRYLDISANPLNQLPVTIASLTRLNRLNVSCCALQSLPLEIVQCIALIHLDVHGNQLTQLPQTIGSFGRLVHANFSFNNVTDLTHVTGLSNLESLDISHNKIAVLPAAVINLKRLETLNCSHNILRQFPNMISSAVAIRRLDLSHNRLTSIPLEIRRMRLLKEIDVSFNELELLPPSLGNIYHLEYLYAVANKITAIPERFTLLRRLKALHVYGNPINFFALKRMGQSEVSYRRLWHYLSQLESSSRRILQCYDPLAHFPACTEEEHARLTQSYGMSTLPGDLKKLIYEYVHK